MKRLLLASLAVLLLTGCVTTGRDFPADPVKSIVNGKTTKEDVRQMFGAPYQTGIEDGRESWTYYRIRHRGAGRTESKELHIVFDKKGLVESYSFSETSPQR